MTAWTSDELAKIGAAEELELASRRRDGAPRKPVTIWVVRHGEVTFGGYSDKPAQGSANHGHRGAGTSRRQTKPSSGGAPPGSRCQIW